MSELVAGSTGQMTFTPEAELSVLTIIVKDLDTGSTVDIGQPVAPSPVSTTTDGVTTYNPWTLTVQSSDAEAGQWEVEWTQTFTGGQKLTQTEYVTINEGLSGWGAQLCTLQQVRDRGQFEDNGSDRDIETAIATLPRILRARYGREFIGQPTTKREFAIVDGARVVGLKSFDLRSASKVTLHSGTADALELTVGVDYVLAPMGGDDLTSTYSQVLLSQPLSLASDFANRFGYVPLSVEGAWGIWGDVSEVPEDIVEAACECVLAWLDKPASSIASIDSSDVTGRVPSGSQSWDIPISAHRKFQPYSRNLGVW